MYEINHIYIVMDAEIFLLHPITTTSTTKYFVDVICTVAKPIRLHMNQESHRRESVHKPQQDRLEYIHHNKLEIFVHQLLVQKTQLTHIIPPSKMRIYVLINTIRKMDSCIFDILKSVNRQEKNVNMISQNR